MEKKKTGFLMALFFVLLHKGKTVMTEKKNNLCELKQIIYLLLFGLNVI